MKTIQQGLLTQVPITKEVKIRTEGCYRVLYILLDRGIYRWCNNGIIVEQRVGLYSVESAADSLADESTEVSRESLLADPLGVFQSQWYIRRSRLSQRFSINTTISRITATTNPIKPTMSFSATSPARISVVVGVVDVARSSMDWTNSERLSPPTHLLSNDSLPESEEDDLVILGTHAVQCWFLDDEGEIELMGEKGPLDKEVEPEVDLKEVKKEEVEEDKEPDKEWRATGTWPSWSNNAGKEWGWGVNAQLMDVVERLRP